MPTIDRKMNVLSVVIASILGSPVVRQRYIAYGRAIMAGTNTNSRTLPNQVKIPVRSWSHGSFAFCATGRTPVSASSERPAGSVGRGVCCVVGSFVITGRVYHGWHGRLSNRGIVDFEQRHADFWCGEHETDDCFGVLNLTACDHFQRF